MMTNLGEVAFESNKLRRVEPASRDINRTSQLWQDSCYCTPQSASLTRAAATRRLHYSADSPPVLLQLIHTSTEPPHAHKLTSQPRTSVDHVTLTSSKVTDAVTSHDFSGEQVDCICDVLRQSKNVDLLRRFLCRLTPDQLCRNSEPLCKV